MRHLVSRSSVSAKSRLTVLLAAVLLLGSAPAWGKRVALTKFTGPKAAKAQKAVAAVIKRDHTVVSTKKLEKAKKKLDIKKLNPGNVQALAEELNVDAIVSGKMKKKGKKYELTITVREGKSGDVIDKHVIKLKGPKVDEKAKGDIAEEVLPTIAAVESIAGGGGEVASAGKAGGKKGKKGADAEKGADDENADDEKAGGDEAGGDEAGGDEAAGDDEAGDKTAEGGAEEPDEKEKKVAMADEGGDGEDEAAGDKAEEVGEADTQMSAEGEERFARDAAIDLALGISFIGRNMSFTYDSTLMNNTPWGYRGNPVPGAYLVAEFYPLAFGGPKGALSGLGLGVNFDRIITLRSRLMSGGDEYDTTQTRWGVGARYRWNVGSSPTGLTVKFMLGYNGLSFVIDEKDAVVDLPDAQYKFVDVGAGARLPLGSPRLAVSLDLRYLQILGTGAMQKMDNYGGASVNGIDVDAAFEFRPMPRLVVKVGGRYTRIGYTFDGSGVKTERDTDAEIDVGGALDQYFGGYVLGGYLF